VLRERGHLTLQRVQLRQHQRSARFVAHRRSGATFRVAGLTIVGSARTSGRDLAGGGVQSSVCACVSLKVSPDAMGWCERYVWAPCCPHPQPCLESSRVSPPHTGREKVGSPTLRP
jgi:hypothetical protein